ncbi:MAG TPA: GNAT family N-acetyltransferase [Nocardioidaceae bacterium]|nr:GNAT family N-acetyltransferase [Nocardioidaceae bacterium]
MPATPPAVRVATPDDLPAVKAIYDEYVGGSIATFDTVPPPLSFWEDKLGRMYVACDPDVIGFAYAGTYRTRPAYDGTVETTIYLAAHAAGRGVGRLLYRALFERLDAEGVHTAVAVIALPNDPSVALHRHFGFVEAGVLREVGHKFDRWIDTAFYQRLLPRP